MLYGSSGGCGGCDAASRQLEAPAHCHASPGSATAPGLKHTNVCSTKHTLPNCCAISSACRPNRATAQQHAAAAPYLQWLHQRDRHPEQRAHPGCGAAAAHHLSVVHARGQLAGVHLDVKASAVVVQQQHWRAGDPRSAAAQQQLVLHLQALCGWAGAWSGAQLQEAMMY